jgi:hypothetical protein
MQVPVTRRRILKAGATVLAVPWLETLARADEKTPPRRIITVCTNFGLYGPSFFPATAGTDYEPSEYLKVLEDLRGDFTVFSGISHPDIGGDHASESCFLTSAKRPTQPGFRNTVSMDVVAAQHVGDATRFPLLTLATYNGSPLTYTETGAQIPSLEVPSQVYAKMFLSGSKAEVEQQLQRLRSGHSLLDSMKGRLGDLTRTVSRHDQQQIRDYAEAVRDMEKQLVAEEAWIGRPKPTVSEPAPTEGYPSPFADPSDSIGRARVMFQLARLAVQTDSTRVVSVFIRGSDAKPPIPGIDQGHHDITHHGMSPEKIAKLKIIETEKMKAFRELLTSLKETKEAGGSLLDNTQVLIGSNLGDASGHGTTNLPILLAGGGYKHGRHVAGDKHDNTPLGKLFVSMLQRFGVETGKFGSGEGTIDGLV